MARLTRIATFRVDRSTTADRSLTTFASDPRSAALRMALGCPRIGAVERRPGRHRLDARLQALLNPPFAKDPPVKLNIPAKTLGAIYAILGAISALFGLLGALALLGLSGAVAVAGLGGVIFLVLIGSLIAVVGTVIAAWGGYRMYQADPGGKTLVIYGLALNALGGLVSALGSGGGGLASWIISLAITFVLYYLVIISRFEGEPKLA